VAQSTPGQWCVAARASDTVAGAEKRKKREKREKERERAEREREEER